MVITIIYKVQEAFINIWGEKEREKSQRACSSPLRLGLAYGQVCYPKCITNVTERTFLSLHFFSPTAQSLEKSHLKKIQCGSSIVTYISLPSRWPHWQSRCFGEVIHHNDDDIHTSVLGPFRMIKHNIKKGCNWTSKLKKERVISLKRRGTELIYNIVDKIKTLTL